MLAALPSQQHRLSMTQTQPESRNMHAPAGSSGQEDKFCAGCSRSVNSETGGVVVAFGNSLWHVDCFKCAKCGNVVNADTTLLLLSDGSPVCANCYNCKVCNLPILDEAVMTGEDSYHAACFTCRTCHNRIDELVFAKTSQGFYCMGCHNERVARSRRHAAKQKQKEKDRQALASASGSGSGRPTASGSGSTSSTGRVGTIDSNRSSSPVVRPPSASHSGYATPPPSSSDGHPHPHAALHPPPVAQSYYSSSSTPSASGSATDPDMSFADTSMMSTNSVADATIVPFPRRVSLPLSSDRHSATHDATATPAPAPQASSSYASPSQQAAMSKAELALAESQARLQAPRENDVSSQAAVTPSIDIAPPPPYSITPPADNVDTESASVRHSAGSLTGSVPSSPVLSIADPHPFSMSAQQAPFNDAASIVSNPSTSSDYLRVSPRDRVDTLPLMGDRGSGGVQWPEGFNPNVRRKSYDDGVRHPSALLYPNGSKLGPQGNGWSTPPLNLPVASTSRRDKRRSINPGFQLDPSKLQQYQSQLQPIVSSSPPTSPTASASSSTPTPAQGYARTHSPPLLTGGRDSPRMPSPLREHFTRPGEDSLDSSISSGTTFYSPSSSPLPMRSDSPASISQSPSTANQAPPSSSSTPPNGPVSNALLAKPPQRSDSLMTRDPNTVTLPSTMRNDADVGRSSPVLNGRLSPSSPAPVVKQQRSFDEREGRLSPSSNRDTNIERSRSVSRSRSASPNVPDVPSGIDSGTDTEAEENAGGPEVNVEGGEALNSQDDDLPPAPPPKEHRNEGKKEEVEEEESPLADALASMEANPDVEDEEEDSRESSPSPPPSPVERRSAFFVAPALPPIRFSMNETDFSEILKSVGGLNSFQSFSSDKRASRQPPTGLPPPTTTPSSAQTLKSEQSTSSKMPSCIPSVMEPDAPSANPDTSPLESTPKPLRRAKSRKGLNGKLPDAIVVEDRHDAVLDRVASTSPTSPVSPSSSRPELPKKSPRRLSKVGAKRPELDNLPVLRESGESGRSDSPSVFTNDTNGREKMDSIAPKQADDTSRPRVPSLLSPPGTLTSRPSLQRQDTVDLVTRRLKEALKDAKDRSADYVKLDRGFIEAILMAMDQKKEQVLDMSGKLDGMKRNSQQIIDGMSVAQEEYDKELSARRDAEEQVTRLRVELSGQTARLTAMSGDDRRRELQKQMSKELTANLDGLERDVSKLKVERDMTLAEVEELSASRSSSTLANNGDVPGATLGRSLTMRLDNIKKQYQLDLVPLTQQRETLFREIMELKEARDIFLEETTVLNARNEELAQLNAQYERRIEPSAPEHTNQKPASSQVPTPSFDTYRSRQAPSLANATSTSTTSSGTLVDEISDGRFNKGHKPESMEMPAQNRSRGIGLRWPGNKGGKELTSSSASENQKGKGRLEHAFQQLSVLRFARCDHCGDKMWGSQLRCSACNVAVHVRCVNHVQLQCAHEVSTHREEPVHQITPPPPSMFGRSLVEQVRADSKGDQRLIPVIVEKCIDAVETLAMDYEGIYRKTGGSSQSKTITQLFECGDYDAFDLRNSDLFNDVSSVTSVLKNYFRSLPDPLLTYDLHESFVSAASIRDPGNKSAALSDLVTKLPREHYHTLCHLMLHLHRVQLQSDRNRMNARNLGVVFGPTLMRSQDVGREFADMAGKALSIEWLVENAPVVFSNSLPIH